MNNTYQSLLECYPVFGLIPPAIVARVLKTSRLVTLRSGAVVFEELQSCKAYPFVLSGSVKVVKRSETGREIALYNVVPGDACVVSSACLLGNKPYNAIGVAQSDCELLMVTAHDFDELLANSVFREFIFSLFARRVLDLMLLIDEVAFRKLDRRLARLLISKGPSVAMSHQDLADELGTVREMITRILNGFCERQWVRLNRGSIQIADAAALERISLS